MSNLTKNEKGKGPFEVTTGDIEDMLTLLDFYEVTGLDDTGVPYNLVDMLNAMLEGREVKVTEGPGEEDFAEGIGMD